MSKEVDPMRRADMLRCTPAELSIMRAMQAVEDMGADVLLTKAVTLLGDARNAIADYVDANLLPVSPHGDPCEHRFTQQGRDDYCIKCGMTLMRHAMTECP